MCFGDTVGATYFYAADFAFSYQSIPRFRADIKYLAHLNDIHDIRILFQHYNYGNLFYVEHNWGDGKGTYSLNYNYAKLKFTLAVDDRSDSMEAVFKVVGDGKVLYSIDISRRFNPVVVEIDVSNVNWIEFYVGEGSDYFSPIYALIADAQLTK